MSENSEEFDRKYKALLSRDKSASFFYGVKTTGIFCRAGCSSRLPKPENTVFFDTSDDALKSGFRPCKRCRPLSSVPDEKMELCVSICRIIEESEDEPSLMELAQKSGYSEGYVQRVFKGKLGISPKEYAQQIKSEKLRDELGGNASISSSIYAAGYGSGSRVYGHLDRILAMTPSQYKNQGEGIRFRMDTFSCSLGYAQIAFTEKGLASVQLGDSAQELKARFLSRFSKADIRELEEEDSRMVKAVLQKIEDPNLSCDVPLDIHGTVFQKRIWNAMREIPAGETRTYSDIAEHIGRPASVRAVANACGKNEIAVVIPCHRVIRKNGDMAGYRWGRERKEKLLEKEQRD